MLNWEERESQDRKQKMRFNLDQLNYQKPWYLIGERELGSSSVDRQADMRL